ncbi:MAG: hypothetical protein OEY79_01075 [Anaplasmataceae bacterium]|nr:hypothetical protein [Candidatus Heimdallarchaeota archaeon]MDH5796118.1 hypothetical protein [Anaplasmataceae bacterium]
MITEKIKQVAKNGTKWTKQPFTLHNGKIIEVSEAQRIFAYHYTQGKTAKACYKIVSPDCTDGTAKVEGHRISHDEDVKLLIHHFKVQNGRKYTSEYDELINNMYKRALIDPINMYDESGKLKRVQEMDEYTRRAISIKHKAQKVSSSKHGDTYQPTLFSGDDYNTEVEFNPKIAVDAEEKFLQLVGCLDDNTNKEEGN